jgi:hypothetical protein
MDNMLFSLETFLSRVFQRTQPKASLSCDLAQVLPGNRGIEFLPSICHQGRRVEQLFCVPLWAHPRIQSVSLVFHFQAVGYSRPTCCMKFCNWLQCNTVVHTIDLPGRAKRRGVLQNFILPRPEMNRNLLKINAKLLRERIFPFVAVFSDEHCTSSATIPIYCFDFCRRMSQRLFARTQDGPIFPLKSERRNLDAARARDYYMLSKGLSGSWSCDYQERMCCRSKGTYSISKQVLVRVSNIYTHIKIPTVPSFVCGDKTGYLFEHSSS